MTWHDGARRLDHDEFVSWTSVGKVFPPLTGKFAERVIARLKSGELEAAANANWKEDRGNLSTGYVVLPPSWWSGVDGGSQSHYATLWKTGEIALYVPDPETGSITQVRFSSVRFKPDDLAAATNPDAAPVPVAPAKRELPPPPSYTARSVGRAPPDGDDGEGDEKPSPAWTLGPPVSAADYDTWITPPEVVRLFADEHVSRDLFAPRLLKCLHDGEVLAAAETATKRRGEKIEKFRLPTIGQALWGRAAPDQAFWTLCELDVKFPSRSQFPDSHYTVRGVRFRPEDIHRMLGGRSSVPIKASEPAEPTKPPAGRLVDIDSLPPPKGRPPAPFWEDLIIAIARRMHLGDFKPATQAEVEDAMARWIMDRGYKEGSGTQIKERARKVFKNFKD